MIQKTTLFLTKCFLFIGIFLFTKGNCYAQTPAIAPQQLPFTSICAGDFVDGSVFNEYFATFTYLNFPTGTTFEVQLSDQLGSFNTPTATTTLEVIDITATQKTIKFAVPEDLIGSDNYSLRIISSTGVTSPRAANFSGSLSFGAYFKKYVAPFFINNKEETAVICSGGNTSLTVYNPTPADPDSSPANFSNLKYKWYRDDVVIAGQSTNTLIVTTPGEYYAELDYGSCSDENFSSNRVAVSTSGSGSAVTIDSSLGNPFCPNGEGTVLLATSGNSYVWKKDGTVITGATARTYSATESGIYTVDVDFGGCTGTGTIDLQSNGFDASIDVADTTVIDPGETLSVSVTTDAASPTYEWFLNGNTIAGANSNTYLVAIKGNYRVVVSQASGCVSSREFLFKVNSSADPTATVIPNIIKLSSNPYWELPDIYKSPDTNVTIISSQGEIVFEGTNYDSSKWIIQDFKNVNPVYYYVIESDTGEKKGSITVIK
ncbi:gliding motility protein SprC [Flavobacterium sp. GA093]|uniref:Gliding motility protein SprC n=1 Tax=Flavobacterium hydrocarbonoxydans TaxID=2683249 RepID=A0A6I4NIH2_9FLAO|nr:gliding motility protein SprC [Flavobacterium hydrocarbonoxydans]MWB93753.1 gliding motility protein SprC [Flavobacterium hydrocarbonoxydans]